MSSKFNKDLTGLLGQGHVSCPKIRQTSLVSLIKCECHRGKAKEDCGMIILSRDYETTSELASFAILEGARLQ